MKNNHLERMHFMSQVDYIIDLQEAEKFIDHIASTLHTSKLQATKNDNKEYLWEIRHPKLLKKQLGVLE